MWEQAREVRHTRPRTWQFVSLKYANLIRWIRIWYSIRVDQTFFVPFTSFKYGHSLDSLSEPSTALNWFRTKKMKLDLNETVEEAKSEQKFSPWFFLGTVGKEFWIGNRIRCIWSQKIGSQTTRRFICHFDRILENRYREIIGRIGCQPKSEFVIHIISIFKLFTNTFLVWFSNWPIYWCYQWVMAYDL